MRNFHTSVRKFQFQRGRVGIAFPQHTHATLGGRRASELSGTQHYFTLPTAHAVGHLSIDSACLLNGLCTIQRSARPLAFRCQISLVSRRPQAPSRYSLNSDHSSERVAASLFFNLVHHSAWSGSTTRKLNLEPSKQGDASDDVFIRSAEATHAAENTRHHLPRPRAEARHSLHHQRPTCKSWRQKDGKRAGKSCAG